MPIKPGSSSKTIGHNIRELQKGPQYKETAKKHGVGTARRQAIAIALDNARKSKQ